MLNDLRWLIENTEREKETDEKERVRVISEAEEYKALCQDERYPKFANAFTDVVKGCIRTWLASDDDKVAQNMRNQVNILLTILSAPEKFILAGDNALEEVKEKE